MLTSEQAAFSYPGGGGVVACTPSVNGWLTILRSVEYFSILNTGMSVY